MKCILHLDVKENSYNAKPINSSHSILSGKSSSFNQSREDNVSNWLDIIGKYNKFKLL